VNQISGGGEKEEAVGRRVEKEGEVTQRREEGGERGLR